MSFEYKWLHKQLVKLRDILVMDGFICLSHTFSLHTEKFREIYNFAFAWAREKGQKSLALETAIGMWQLLFAERSWPLIDYWCQFLQVRHNKAISRDTWAQLLEFVKTIDPQLTNYDEEGAWPYLIDEFVDYLKENGLVQHRR